jgi:hypothetical protein
MEGPWMVVSCFMELMEVVDGRSVDGHEYASWNSWKSWKEGVCMGMNMLHGTHGSHGRKGVKGFFSQSPNSVKWIAELCF